MLEAAATPAYKDLLEALGKLSEWTEQVGPGGLPSGPPPEDLVRQFNEALAGTAVEAMQSADSLASSHNGVRAQQTAVPESSPADVVAESDLFPAGQKVVHTDRSAAPEQRPSELSRDSIGIEEAEDDSFRGTDTSMTSQDRQVEGVYRDVGGMTESQKVNLDMGLDMLKQAAQTHHSDFFESAHRLSELLSKSAMEISPLDLLHAQRLVGILKVQSESGRKVSEGVSDTLEQLLEQQG